jgi:lysozyme
MVELISHEAIVLRRYKDSLGNWTIGVGHTRGAGYPDPMKVSKKITVRQAVLLFKKDLNAYVNDVNNAFTVPLSQHQFDAAVSFHFNTGAIKKASWVRHVNNGRYLIARDSIKSGMMAWRKPKEIIKRREREHALFFNGDYSAGNHVMVYSADKEGRVLWRKGRKFLIKINKVLKKSNICKYCGK